MKKTLILMLLLCGIVSTNVSLAGPKNVKKQKTTAAVKKAQRDSLILDSVMTLAKAGNPVAQNTLGTYYYTGKYTKQDYDMAAKWWALSAKQNNTDAVGNLGLCFQFGRGVERDSVKAVELYSRAIEMGNQDLFKERNAETKSAFNLMLIGHCLENGIGGSKSPIKAAEMYAKAAAMGSKDGIRLASLLYYANQQYQASAPLLKKGAEMGIKECVYPWAESLYKGQGVEKDLQQAAVYMLRAAEAGHSMAQYEVATMYNKGEGMKHSPASALKWYKKAASTQPWAQYATGVCFVNGQGTKQSYDEGLYWIARSIQSNKSLLDQFNKKLKSDDETGWAKSAFPDYLKGVKAYSKKDYAAAEKIFKQLQKQNVVDATTMLGVLYLDKGWKKNNAKKAAKYLTQASEKGDTKASYLLGRLFEQGNGVLQDAKKGLALITQAADNDYAPALSYLGELYLAGNRVKKSDVAAADCFRKALENGAISSQALRHLASMYERGEGGLKKNPELAKNLNKRAEEASPVEVLMSKMD